MKTVSTWMNRLAVVTAAACGTVAGAQQLPPPGHAMRFNGTNAFVRISDHPLLDFSRTVTFEMWVNPTSFGTQDGTDLLTKGDGVHDTDRAYEIALGSTQDPEVGYGHFYAGGSWFSFPRPTWTPALNRWTHLAITVDADEHLARIYRDGILSVEATIPRSASIRNSSLPIYLGCRNTLCCGLGLRRFFTGMMDEVRLWNVARTPEQIAASFNTTVPPNSPGLIAYYTFDEGTGATVLDRTGNGLHGTVNGGATWELIAPACPAVTAQPASQTVCAGTPVTLEAAFSGTSPNLQWRRDGQPITGATGATLTIASPTAADAGTYDCVATNACGSATTAPAIVAVPAPQILTAPTDQAVNVDQPVMFVVETDAASACSGSLRFQWQRRDPQVADPHAANAWITLRDGGGVVGSTDPTLVILRPTPGLATGFRCKITGGCGCEFAASSTHHTNTVNFTIACPADFNADGGVDFGDIEEFFTRWENGC
jgi:hypothetical protein